MLRTLVILAFLLAISSLVSASFFIASKERLTSAGKREKWIDASICPKFFPSIDFWLCLSWPVTSFVWWVIMPWQRLWNVHWQDSDTHLFLHATQVDYVVPCCNYFPCHDQPTRSYIRWRPKLGCCTFRYHLSGDTHLCNILPHFQIPLRDKELNLYAPPPFDDSSDVMLSSPLVSIWNMVNTTVIYALTSHNVRSNHYIICGCTTT